MDDLATIDRAAEDLSGIPGGAQPQDDWDTPTPPADLPEDEDTGDEEAEGLVLDGDHQLSLTIGGAKPTSSVLKLKGGSLELDGEFRKGSRLRVTLDLRVGAVKIEDTVDSGSGEVKSTKRTQWATIEGVQRVDGE